MPIFRLGSLLSVRRPGPSSLCGSSQQLSFLSPLNSLVIESFKPIARHIVFVSEFLFESPLDKIRSCAVKKLFKINHENTKVWNVLKANAAKHETRHENQLAGDGFLRCDTYSRHLL